MQTNITLELDSEVVRKAEAVARKNGESLSRLVENLLTKVGKPPVEVGEDGLTPLVRSLKGSLGGSEMTVEDYRKSLIEKYL